MIIEQFLKSLTREEVAAEVRLKPKQVDETEVITIAIARIKDGRLAIQTASMTEQVDREFMLAATARMLQLTARNSGLGLEGAEELVMRLIPYLKDRRLKDDTLDID